MKKCYKVKNLFGPYIYNIATNEERDAVESHIKICDKCAKDLRTRQIILKKHRLFCHRTAKFPYKMIDSPKMSIGNWPWKL